MLKLALDRLAYDPSLKSKKTNLLERFKAILDSEKFGKEWLEREKKRNNLNYYHAYRMILTPTLIQVLPLSQDESCRVIRHYLEEGR